VLYLSLISVKTNCQQKILFWDFILSRCQVEEKAQGQNTAPGTESMALQKEKGVFPENIVFYQVARKCENGTNFCVLCLLG